MYNKLLSYRIMTDEIYHRKRFLNNHYYNTVVICISVMELNKIYEEMGE